MSVNSTHPAYTSRIPDWEILNDCYRGERAIKEKREKYLPPTEGMSQDGVGRGKAGENAYRAYLLRAMFPDFIKQGVEAMVGIMHQEPPRIEVPDEMEDLLKHIGADGESVLMLMRKINEYQLVFGRCGILIESPSGLGPSEAMPFLVVYPAHRILNWDNGVRTQGRQVLEFVTLDESDYERTGGLQWKFQNRYRMLALDDVVSSLFESDQEAPAQGEYVTKTFVGSELQPTQENWITPQIAGRSLDQVPFIFVNTKDLNPSPDDPPMLGLANLCLSIYRSEADYRQYIHQQGQDTLVVIGGEEGSETPIGASARIDLPIDADAKFIGVTSDGLDAMRQAITGDKELAESMTSRLLETQGSTYQSGEALKIRVSAKTATLRTIAETSAEAMRRALQIIAEWIGADPEQVVVEANTKFNDTATASRTALELQQAKNTGLPMSRKSVHRFLVKQGLTVMSYEDEVAALEDEVDVPPPSGVQGVGGIAGGIAGGALGGAGVPRGAPENEDEDEGDED